MIKFIFLKLNAIVYFKSEDKVVTAHLLDDYFFVSYTLDGLQNRVDPEQFIRIHRSSIVNLNYIHTIEPLLGGTYLMKMNDKKQTELNVSRNAAKTIRARLGW
ncbi:MAG TPA: LytTR family transcriptional regulator [Calditrichaeota bacterium]|nr:LytTR family transcriptional regulator [Calditrichota bacterium]